MKKIEERRTVIRATWKITFPELAEKLGIKNVREIKVHQSVTDGVDGYITLVEEYEER